MADEEDTIPPVDREDEVAPEADEEKKSVGKNEEENQMPSDVQINPEGKVIEGNEAEEIKDDTGVGEVEGDQSKGDEKGTTTVEVTGEDGTEEEVLTNSENVIQEIPDKIDLSSSELNGIATQTPDRKAEETAKDAESNTEVKSEEGVKVQTNY